MFAVNVGLMVATLAAALAAHDMFPQDMSASSRVHVPLPSANQLRVIDTDMTMFVHFSMCTFADCEHNIRNCGKHPASQFVPSALNASQWVETAAALGAKCGELLDACEALGHRARVSTGRGVVGEVVLRRLAHGVLVLGERLHHLL